MDMRNKHLKEAEDLNSSSLEYDYTLEVIALSLLGIGKELSELNKKLGSVISSGMYGSEVKIRNRG